MSFSAHADAKGILRLLAHLRPKKVVLVHGETSKQKAFKLEIEEALEIPCFNPANHEMLEIEFPLRQVINVP